MMGSHLWRDKQNEDDFDQSILRCKEVDEWLSGEGGNTNTNHQKNAETSKNIKMQNFGCQGDDDDVSDDDSRDVS